MPSVLWLVVMMTPQTVEDAVLAQVLFVDAQHVGRRGGVGLHVVVEREAVDVAEVARLVDAQDHRLQEAVEAAEHLLRRHLGEIPWPDRVLDRLQQRVLADALQAAEHERVVDLLVGPLHAVRQPMDDVIGVVGIDLVDVVEPRAGLGGVAGSMRRRPIEVEAASRRALDPAAL